MASLARHSPPIFPPRRAATYKCVFLITVNSSSGSCYAITMAKSADDRIAELEQQKQQIANRIARLRTIESTKERKRDTRLKILAWACVLDRADKDQASARHLKKILDAFLTKPQDRALFDLPPRPKDAC